MPKGRPAAIAAALLLIGASVFGGALSASAVGPNAPVITSPTDGAYLAGTPTAITGNADGNNAIDITVTNAYGTDQPYCGASTGTGSGGIPWTGCSGPLAALPLGDNVFKATAYLASDPGAGSTASAPVTVHVYDTTPTTMTTYPSGSSADSYPDFAGRGPAEGTVQVKDGLDNVLCSTTIDVTASWSCSMLEQPTGTAYVGVAALATDQGGNLTTSPQSTSFSIANPAVPTITQSYASPWVVDTTAVTVGGTSADDIDTLTVQISPDNANWSGLCAFLGFTGNTSWNCAPGVDFFNGPTYVRIQGTRANEETSAWSASTLVTVVQKSTISDLGLPNDNTPSFSGTAQGEGPSSIVDVLVDDSPICSSAIVGGNWSCTASTPILDGSHSYRTSVDTGSPRTQHNSSDYQSLTIDTTAPNAPTLFGPASPTTGRTPTFYGSGDYDGAYEVDVNGAPVTCVGGAPAGDDSGNWQCQLANPLDNNDSYVIRARQTDNAGNTSAWSAPYTLIVGVLPVPPPAPTPTPSPSPNATPTPAPTPKVPLVWGFSTGGKTEFLPGDEVDITSSGLPAGSTVDAVLHSTPVTLGSTTVKPDGSFSMHVIIPADTPPGAHHFVVSVTPPGEDPSVVEVPATVKPAPKQAASGPKKTLTEAETPAGATGTDRDDPGAPSSLTHSLKSIFDFISNPVAIAIAAAAGLVFLLFVAFPAELLNSTLEAQYERIAKRIPRVRAQWWNRFTEWLDRRPLVGAGVMIVIASVIFSFADPGFGFDITSLRLVLACAIALFVVGYLASVISGLILGRRLHLDTRMEIKPLGLILTVVGVVVSRLIDFTPGFLIGLLLGLALLGRAKSADRAKSMLVQSGVVFVLAILAWAGYGILSTGAEPETFASSLMTDTLVAITTEGLTGLFIGLLPFRFLDGQEIYQFSRVLWVASYAVAAFAFVAVVVPFANNWLNEGSSFWLWIGIVAAFTVLSVGVYLYFRRRDGREDEEDADNAEGAGETVADETAAEKSDATA